jgi:calcium-dependent protein kinase
MNLAKFAVRASQTEQRFQYAVLSFIASQLVTHTETERLERIFSQLDKNGDGKLSEQELRQGYSSAGITVNLEDLLRECDADGNGFIDYTEFLTATISWTSSMSDKRLKSAFEAFDLDHNGRITLDELKQVIGSDDSVEDDFWTKLLNDADDNGDGEIDFEEFKGLMHRNINRLSD